MKELGPRHPKFTGIPESSGIFYAMGAALMFEGKVRVLKKSRVIVFVFLQMYILGILSGCYHICPTANNFQFDTTFMYCISVLVFLKVLSIFKESQSFFYNYRFINSDTVM